MKININSNFKALYKYTKTRYLSETLNSGKFRIGTLYEYRNNENDEIGDEAEGKKQYFFPAEIDQHKAYSQLAIKRPHLSRENMSNVFSDEQLTSAFQERLPLAIEEISPDCYLYCLTSKFDESVMRRFGYDACMEICAPERFMIELSKSMVKSANFGLLSACQYLDRFNEYNNHNSFIPQILKPKNLRHQCEVRLCWDPKGQRAGPKGQVPLKPLFIKSMAAARYCKRII